MIQHRTLAVPLPQTAQDPEELVAGGKKHEDDGPALLISKGYRSESHPFCPHPQPMVSLDPEGRFVPFFVWSSLNLKATLYTP